MGQCFSCAAEGTTTVKAVVNSNVAAGWTPADIMRQTQPGDLQRTYHKDERAPYILPDDVKEGSRLNLQHHLIRHLFGGPNFAGVKEKQLLNGLTVLDIGCGTGIWLAEMNRDFPKGEYHGVDLTTTEWAKTFKDSADGKIKLHQGNVLKRLPYADNTFDYVHQQLLVAGIPRAKWPEVLFEICRVLKPGGVLDLVETDLVHSYRGTPNKREHKFKKLIVESLNARGINPRPTRDLPLLVRSSARFTNVVSLPKEVRAYGGEIGELWKLDAKNGYVAGMAFMTATLGISPEEWNRTVDDILDSSEDSGGYGTFIRITASKV
ncbi:S-adenosyl-L-methionine-dependent methyltransferase [Cladochytrium replicatum]|nr:S-adenosyl-L-methionine-dependent methyltransferase [Cladochytrium replicatum]